LTDLARHTLIALMSWQYGVELDVEKWGSVLPILAVIVGSYVAGMVITPFSWLWDLPSVLIAPCILGSSSIWPWKVWSEVTGRMDVVGARSPEAGATLAKMMAETTLCENLFTVALLSTWMALARVPSGHWLSLPACSWLFLASLLAVGMVLRQWAFLVRLSTFERSVAKA
jgi:hypothetical protein